MRRVTGIAVAMSTVLAGCPTVPDHDHAWLSYKYSRSCPSGNLRCAEDRNDTNGWSYYRSLGIDDPDLYTFDAWLAETGFPATVETHAIYANLFDLQFGRDMSCAQIGTRVACYVANFGPSPYDPFTQSGRNSDWPNVSFALDQALNAGFSFGTVAMVYDSAKPEPNQVSFYAFGDRDDLDADGNVIATHHDALLYTVALDSEGPKSVPRMCMACHGGGYDSTTDTASGARFLPFDVFSFRYPNEAGWSFEEQQVALRKLNELVVATNPGDPIVELVDGLYQGDVHADGPAVDGYVPTGWLGNPDLYRSVVRPYCRTCHVAQSDPYAFRSLSDFENVVDVIKTAVCDTKDMPHAQVPFGVNGTKVGFWNDRVAQQDLGNFFKDQLGENCLPSD
jgi:hypothetical protein